MFRTPATRSLAGRVPLSGSASCLGRRTFTRARNAPSGRAVENLNVHQLSQRAHEYQRNRRVFLTMGAVASGVAFLYTAWELKKALSNPTRLDSSLPSTDALQASDAAERKVVLHDEQGREIVPTGNSTVPDFPRTIEVPSYGPEGELAGTVSASTPTEYTLVGLGLRTVSFLSIQVYVVGYYVATADIASLQSALVKKVNPMATTLIPGEKDHLRNALLDPVEGQETWSELLDRGIPARSVFRVVPVRDTDFHHLRDGFVRAIQANHPSTGPGDDAFGEAVRDFRALFNRGSVPKKRELLLMRDGSGRLHIAYDDGKKGGSKLLGTVNSPELSKALWLNYLAGKKVASEPARKSIVEGIMEFVERPVGTVATQVV